MIFAFFRVSVFGELILCSPRRQRAEEFVEVRRNRLARWQEVDVGFALFAVLAVEGIEYFFRWFGRAEHLVKQGR